MVGGDWFAPFPQHPQYYFVLMTLMDLPELLERFLDFVELESAGQQKPMWRVYCKVSKDLH
jgi:hypothetical protein